MKRSLVAMAALTLFACSHGAPPAETKAPTAAAVDATDVFRFHVGSLEAIALKDGDIHIPNDGKTVGVGQGKEAVGALLSSAGVSAETIDFSIQPLAVRDGARILLFDTGAGDASFAKAGRLTASLRAASIEPSAVTDVFLSHGHPDHIGGFVTPEGTSAFPKARIHVSAPEWEAMRADPKHASLVKMIGPQVDAFAPNATILPSVTAVAVRGHTPGHSAYRISSGSEHLLYVGDSVHHSVVSVQKPDWTIAFDLGGDAPTAQASRRALLEQASTENLRIYAGHFPFPGIGHVRKQGDGFVWVPEAK
ncbi:hypothetical protein AKJ09_05191 [Labilithrix luteola]|uniref:Metallo-beta-lactamase domain-containing protein n=1 Tax=Labilithrix luteola TaxID=1391654 RepID=A0A0K1PYE5_9BACT|nr:MBL fold metallo-hydrolase [Labilithrix luteola]AKU98527.1 hypothetical protein AKJ09_05191 [Labilithrix luteola]